MRLFAAERISGMMDKLKIPEDLPIESKIVSKAIDWPFSSRVTTRMSVKTILSPSSTEKSVMTFTV